MNADKIISILKKECEKSGSQKAWAKDNGLSQAYVCDVLQGKRGIGESIAKALGYEQIVSYRRFGGRKTYGEGNTDMTPHRVQRKRVKGWKMPPNTVYVGRPTAYGNPFSVGRVGGAAKAVADYREWIKTNYDQSQIEQLRGRNLACWCALDQPCHADVLLEVANAE